MVKDKIICVYKITSPSGKIYIGSSVNYKRRLTQYKGMGAKTQTILYNSFLKHGFDNHIFEIIELCTKENLLEREYYYGSLYEVIPQPTVPGPAFTASGFNSLGIDGYPY